MSCSITLPDSSLQTSLIPLNHKAVNIKNPETTKMALKHNPNIKLPKELQVAIFAEGDTSTVRAMRLACRDLSKAGFHEIKKRIPSVINKPDPVDYTGNVQSGAALVHGLIDIVHERMQVAERITGLNVRYEANEAKEARQADRTQLINKLPAGLSKVRLPSLSSLSLGGVVVERSALLDFFEAHKTTLKSVVLERLELSIDNPDERPPEERSRSWTTVLDSVRKIPHLRQFSIDLLSWNNSIDGRSSSHYLETVLNKYGLRFADPERTQWYRMWKRRVEARGRRAVQGVLVRFVSEVRARNRIEMDRSQARGLQEIALAASQLLDECMENGR